MIVKINENISIDYGANPLTGNDSSFVDQGIKRISIKEKWFKVISLSELVRKRSEEDGYYRVVYIQVNMESGEYYIGKANRPKWSDLKRYQGSGLKFKSKYKKNKDNYTRFFIASCSSSEETERVEASIVTEELILDEYCLNLITGGGGTSKRPSVAESRQKKREYMLNNPDRYKAMLIGSKKAFQSGDTPALRARSKRIKEVMSDEKYREMSRDRIKKWMEENPEEYQEARKKNHKKIKTKKVQKKRQKSLEKWKLENPDEYKKWQDKLIQSRTSSEANEKRGKSIKEFNKANPEQAKLNAQKRSMASIARTSKAVSMLDLKSGKVLKEFKSAQEAGRWLISEGITRSKNPAGSISAVCNRRPCTTGYGFRKKAYGYDWRFSDEVEAGFLPGLG